jgi:hypothetical protein
MIQSAALHAVFVNGRHGILREAAKTGAIARSGAPNRNQPHLINAFRPFLAPAGGVGFLLNRRTRLANREV